MMLARDGIGRPRSSPPDASPAQSTRARLHPLGVTPISWVRIAMPPRQRTGRLDPMSSRIYDASGVGDCWVLLGLLSGLFARKRWLLQG